MPKNKILTAAALLSKGYFNDRLIPPFSSQDLEPLVKELLVLATSLDTKAKKKRSPIRSRCVFHSVPKQKHLRRILAIPNPFHQVILASAIESSWGELTKFCKKSKLSVSNPVVSDKRALQAQYELNELPRHRALRSIGTRYLLKTDLTRFYPSIYTHSIPWALHGKTAARLTNALYGNKLDACVRETQDKQTGGIPIGPDTSFLLGEVMGTAIDLALSKRLKKVRGTRYIDDFCLYFETLAEAEKGLAILHQITKEFELEVNESKTEIIDLPEAFEPVWKAELRNMQFRERGRAQETDLIALFNRAFDLSNTFKNHSVLTYAVRRVGSETLDEANWSVCESLLLRSVLAEPTCTPYVIEVIESYLPLINPKSIKACVESLCQYHSRLQQGYEVAWALWLASVCQVRIGKTTADLVATVEDDIVALVSLALIEDSILPKIKMPLWKEFMRKEHLYEEHWLLAYEARIKDWLPSLKGDDYVGNDPYFSVLQKRGVSFYKAPEGIEEYASPYSDAESQPDGIALLKARLALPPHQP
jgi:hypothetical protein